MHVEHREVFEVNKYVDCYACVIDCREKKQNG